MALFLLNGFLKLQKDLLAANKKTCIKYLGTVCSLLPDTHPDELTQIKGTPSEYSYILLLLGHGTAEGG